MKSNYVYGLVLVASFLIGLVLLKDRPKTSKTPSNALEKYRKEQASIHDSIFATRAPRDRKVIRSLVVEDEYEPDVVVSSRTGGGDLESDAMGERRYDTWEPMEVPILKNELISSWTKYSRICGEGSGAMTCAVAINCAHVPAKNNLILETFRRATLHRFWKNRMIPSIAIVLYFSKQNRELAASLYNSQNMSLQANIRLAPDDWLSEEQAASAANIGAAYSIYVLQHALRSFEWVLLQNSSYIPSTQTSRLSPPRPAAELFPLLTYFDILGRPFPRPEDTFTASSQMVLFATTFLYVRRSQQALTLLEQWKENLLKRYHHEASRFDELFIQALTLGVSINQPATPVAASLLDPSLCLYDHLGADVAAHQEIQGKRIMPSRFAFCDAYIQD